MDEKPVATSYSREKLFVLVWQKPMRLLAKEFGLSDTGLAKACRKHGIRCRTAPARADRSDQLRRRYSSCTQWYFRSARRAQGLFWAIRSPRRAWKALIKW